MNKKFFKSIAALFAVTIFTVSCANKNTDPDGGANLVSKGDVESFLGKLIEPSGPLSAGSGLDSQGNFTLALAKKGSTVATIEKFILEKLGKNSANNIKAITEDSISHNSATRTELTDAVTYTISLEAIDSYTMPNEYKTVKVVVSASSTNPWSKVKLLTEDFKKLAEKTLADAIEGFTPKGDYGIMVSSSQSLCTIKLQNDEFSGANKYTIATNSIEKRYNIIVKELSQMGITSSSTKFKFSPSDTSRDLKATIENIQLGALYELGDLNSFSAIEINYYAESLWTDPK